MMYTVLMLSIMLVMSFVGFSSKPSPIYGGFGLIVGGGVGCGMVMNFGGSFLGLIVFLVYLGGMLVVFGYTTAMATEEYPEVWGSNVVILGAVVLGFVVEGGVMFWLANCDGVGYMFCSLKYVEDWMVHGYGNGEFVRGDCAGVSSLYDFGGWLILLAGWALFVSIFIVIEITRGK